MWCQSCREEYEEADAGTCKECYEEASETEEELKREIEDLKSKVAFLRLISPLDFNHQHQHQHQHSASSDIILLRAASDSPGLPTVPAVPAHRAVLVIY